jgi:hypothetical protein
MSYVDAIQRYPQCRLRYQDWCHMATDGDMSELHAMAARLGFRRAWFQHKPTHPHYDLTPAKRAQAITLGAQAVSTYELLRCCYPETLGKGLLRRTGEMQV